MLNFIDIYTFIPVCCYVGMGPSELLCLRAFHAKTVLGIIRCFISVLTQTRDH